MSWAAGQAVYVRPNVNVTGPVTIGAGGSLDVEGGRDLRRARDRRRRGRRPHVRYDAHRSTHGHRQHRPRARRRRRRHRPLARQHDHGLGPDQRATRAESSSAATHDPPVTIAGNTGTLPPPDTGPVHAAREHGDRPGPDPGVSRGGGGPGGRPSLRLATTTGALALRVAAQPLLVERAPGRQAVESHRCSRAQTERRLRRALGSLSCAAL